MGIAVDSAGNIYVSDSFNNRIQTFNSLFQFQLAWGTAGDQPGEYNQPSGVAVDSLGNVYVADNFNHRVQKFNSCVYLAQWGLVGSTPSDDPGAFDSPV